MAFHYDFKIMVAAKMTRLLNSFVDPADITLGVPSAPSFSTPRNSVVDVTYKGVTRQIAYDRFNFNKSLVGMPTSRTTINITKIDPATQVNQLNMVLGTAFTLADFDSVTVDANTSTANYTFTATHLSYIGKFSITALIPFEDEVEFNNIWTLNNNQVDTGTAGANMPGVWSFPTIAGTLWGRLDNGRTPLMLPTGSELPLSGEFVYDFDFIFTSVPVYHCLFGVDPLGDGYVKSTGCIYFYYGRMYIYGVTSQFGPTMVANVATRWTFHGTGGQLKIYANGTLVHTVAQPNVTLVCFRNSEAGATVFGQNSAIRNFRVLRRTPTGGELTAILAGTALKPQYPRPVHEVAFAAADYSNKGSSGTPLNSAIPSMNYNGKNFFGFNTPSGIKALGFSMNFTGNFTVDFEVAATSFGDAYSNVFQASAAAGSFTNGDFTAIRAGLAEGDRPYLYNITTSPITNIPMRNGTVVRNTIIRKGSTIYWYENGVLIAPGVTGNTAISFIWSYLDARRNLTLFRNLRFWDRALTDLERDAVLANK